MGNPRNTRNVQLVEETVKNEFHCKIVILATVIPICSLMYI
jgi:hypothetical protein